MRNVNLVFVVDGFTIYLFSTARGCYSIFQNAVKILWGMWFTWCPCCDFFDDDRALPFGVNIGNECWVFCRSRNSKITIWLLYDNNRPVSVSLCSIVDPPGKKMYNFVYNRWFRPQILNDSDDSQRVSCIHRACERQFSVSRWTSTQVRLASTLEIRSSVSEIYRSRCLRLPTHRSRCAQFCHNISRAKRWNCDVRNVRAHMPWYHLESRSYLQSWWFIWNDFTLTCALKKREKLNTLDRCTRIVGSE